MRVVLIYPPPWKIARPGEEPYPRGEGEPDGGSLVVDDGDFPVIPYGLLTLAAEAINAGHDVRVLNLSLFAWSDVEAIIADIDGDVFGLSSLTLNRRGVEAVSKLVRRVHPEAHVTVGGPHATALPPEMLNYHRAVDSVVVGEGEATFLELLERLGTGTSLVGTAGLAFRLDDEIRVEDRRRRIKDLDSLADPLAYFPSSIILTSRGCPGSCTFCASQVVWGKALRFHGAEYVLTTVQRAVNQHGLTRIAIKDDTFTADRGRVLAICRGIEERGLRFTWSCDTRADAVDDELLAAMRRAGCLRISLGVESGSPEVLANINKRTTLEQVLEATRTAQRYGFDIRYYMMLGNRGETRETLQQSLDFIEKANPNEVTFSLLAGHPGTADFERMVEQGRVTSDIFFDRDSLVPILFLGEKADMAAIFEWYEKHRGYYRLSDPSDGLDFAPDIIREQPAYPGPIELGEKRFEKV